jgi:hypothetical protein
VPLAKDIRPPFVAVFAWLLIRGSCERRERRTDTLTVCLLNQHLSDGAILIRSMGRLGDSSFPSGSFVRAELDMIALDALKTRAVATTFHLPHTTGVAGLGVASLLLGADNGINSRLRGARN